MPIFSSSCSSSNLEAIQVERGRAVVDLHHAGASAGSGKIGRRDGVAASLVGPRRDRLRDSEDKATLSRLGDGPGAGGKLAGALGDGGKGAGAIALVQVAAGDAVGLHAAGPDDGEVVAREKGKKQMVSISLERYRGSERRGYSRAQGAVGNAGSGKVGDAEDPGGGGGRGGDGESERDGGLHLGVWFGVEEVVILRVCLIELRVVDGGMDRLDVIDEQKGVCLVLYIFTVDLSCQQASSRRNRD